MFPWPVFKVSGPWGRARPQGTGQGHRDRNRHRHRRHRYPGAQSPGPRVQCPGGLIDGKLEPWKGNGSRSGHRRRRWDVGPSGRETQGGKQAGQGKKQPQHEERAAGWLLSRIGITSRQPRTVAGLRCRCLGTRHGPGAARGYLPSQLQHRTQARPDQPDQATAQKGRHESPHTAWPPYLKPHSRRPTLSAPRLPTCQLGPALPFVTLIYCSAAQLSRSRSHGKHHQGFYNDA